MITNVAGATIDQAGSAGAWQSMMGQPDSGEPWPARLRWLAAMFFVVAGLLHFVAPDFYRHVVPPGLPWRGFLVVLSGVCEIAGGLGLLVPQLRRWAGWGLMALLVAVFPANVYMALAPHGIVGLSAPVWLLWLRLPFQAVFMAWVWYVALRRGAERSAFPRLADVEPSPAVALEPAPRPVRFRLLDKLLLTVVVAYGTVLVAAWLLLYVAADYRWWATIFLFAPRWIWAVPLPLMAIVFALRRRRLGFVCCALLIGAAGLIDIHCPWRKVLELASTDPHLRVLTFNCDSWALDPADLHRLIVEFDPDIVALQDVETAHLPVIFGDSPRPWKYVDVEGYLVLASRYPIRASANSDDPTMSGVSGTMRRYELDVDGTSVQVFNLHLMSPRWGLRTVQTVWWRGAGMLQAASDGRRHQAEIAGRWIAGYRNAIVAGDFNTPPESPVFRNNFGELSSAFTVAGWGMGSTYFAGWFSLRLDQILCDDQWQPQGCWIGANVGSEHRPLTAVLARTRED